MSRPPVRRGTSSKPSGASSPRRAPSRLTYFHGRGLAERIRWMLACVSEPFENVGLDEHEECLELRRSGKLLFHQLPLLEIDGLQLTQSKSCVRYLAEKYSMVGRTPAEKVDADMLAEAVFDFVSVPTGAAFALSRGETEAELTTRAQASIDKYCPRFEEILARRAGGRAGAGPTAKDTPLTGYADVVLAEALTSFCDMGFSECIRREYPRCDAVRATVVELPQMKAYLGSDKRFPFPGPDYVANVNKVLGR